MIINIIIFILALLTFRKINHKELNDLPKCEKRQLMVPLIAIIVEIVATVILDITLIVAYSNSLNDSTGIVTVLLVFLGLALFILPVVVSVYAAVSLIGVTSIIFANWCYKRGLKVPLFYKVMTLICCITSAANTLGLGSLYVNTIIEHIFEM